MLAEPLIDAADIAAASYAAATDTLMLLPFRFIALRDAIADDDADAAIISFVASYDMIIC